jgi:hypothetical protein
MLQRISLTTADGLELFSGVSLLRSDPPPPPPAASQDDFEDSQVHAAELLAKNPSNDNGKRAVSHSTLRAAVPPPPMDT